ncbi:RHS repeat-associated core domain-containing protein [Mucilaginibacter sp. 14171R-50]|uniref:DUF6443 domain-containing protein n=1 Tax=Mucilaginibacter sp. 14171R-50 TaxID=2703789 RepID=UPI00138CB8E8|nr:DUF6443 domain-containing protein [Mucilaginibacter sp. 14171R-50]QHS56421.1 RHS repeat-associated core domain-containing protein [Mucilaginibacter sp. 14171R-50]
MMKYIKGAFLWALIVLFITPLKAQTYINTPMTGTPAAGQYYNEKQITLSPNFTFTASSGQTLKLFIKDCVPLTLNLSSSQNYVMISTPRISGITTRSGLANRTTCELMQNVQYFDGLGRPIQTIQIKGSPGYNDLVQPIAYDSLNRETVKYLPYASTSANGSYRSAAITNQLAFYDPAGVPDSTSQLPGGIAHISTPYAMTKYEPSALGRVLEQGAPGDPWQLTGTINPSGVSSGHTIKTSYSVNNTLALTDTANTYLAALYTVTINPNQSRTLVRLSGADGNYLAGELTVKITKDENWQSGRGGTSEEYIDKEGRIVLKRTFSYLVGAPNELQILSTYYVYDDVGNLAYVLPPKSNADNTVPTQTILNNLCYQYRYDEYNRLSQKRVPGKGWENMVYNKLDQIVLTQDSVQRGNNQWTVNKYDGLGRVIITGLWNAGANIPLTTLQDSIYAASQWDIRDYANNTTGYKVTSYPALTKTLTINYYDNYTNIPTIPPGLTPTPGTYSNLTKGLVTVSKTAVLNTLSNTEPDMLWNVNYYDNKGRVVKAYMQHYLGGTLSSYNYDDVSNTYDFTDKITATSRKQYTKNADNTAAILAVSIANQYNYDQADRKRETFERINSDPQVLVSRLDYNAIGQLKTKHLHGLSGTIPFLQDINYLYNERAWLLSGKSNTNLFNFSLAYNKPNAGVSPQFNGNIAQMEYTKTGSSNVNFNYRYDQLNRLKSALSSDSALDETIDYDVMGNITKLVRSGSNSANLNYSYYNANLNNRLQTVTNNGNAFRSYAYDGNGNATSDGGTKNISYNLLNLPQTIKQADTILATYTYDVGGRKLRNVGSDGGWDYINGIVYTNNVINFIQTEEGRIKNISGVYNYEYNLKDQLGNVRLSFDRDPVSGLVRRLQEDEYYSFGLRKTPVDYDILNHNRYLYNAKEIQLDLTNQYDYGARFYDPVIGRFTTVDPLADKMRRVSTYNHAFNNPLRFIDADGMAPTDVIIGGDDKQAAFEELQKSVKGQLTLSMDDKGNVTYSKSAPDPLIGKDAKQLIAAIDDHTVNVNVTATKGNIISTVDFVGGAFLGNDLLPSGNVNTKQVISPEILEKMDNYFGSPGKTTLHEVTESYNGAKIAQSNGVSSPFASPSEVANPNSDYQKAHKAATDQSGPVIEKYYGPLGGRVSKPGIMGKTEYILDNGVKPAVPLTSKTYPQKL